MTDESRLWHVTVTVSGASVEPLLVRAALHRLAEQRPFLSSVRFSARCAEVCYWDEADTMLDAAALALRMWNEYRDAASLPPWEVTGLEVLEQDLRTGREQRDALVELAVVPSP